MPYTISQERSFQLLVRCLGGKQQSACRDLDFHLALGMVEARLAKELKVNLVADVDPDGAAAAPQRFFLANRDAKLKLRFATEFRQALTKLITAVDEEIAELSQAEGIGR